jgi:hypothetical protein
MAQRFAAKQSYSLGFHFRHGARRLIGIGHVDLIAVEECMGNLVEERLGGSAATGLTATFRPRVAYPWVLPSMDWNSSRSIFRAAIAISSVHSGKLAGS